MPARTVTERSDRPRRAKGGPTPWLIRQLDFERPALAGSRHCLTGVTRVEMGRGELAVRRSGDVLSLAIPDTRMSQHHARVTLELGRWAVVDLDSRNGVIVDGQRRDRVVLQDGARFELGRTAFLFRHLPSGGALDVDATAPQVLPPIATLSPAFAAALGALERIARSSQSVLLHGETGTGKELLARAVHTASGRPGPWVVINCGALPPTLVESELFGSKRGAFSGAVEDRPGLFRAADGGTVFLDEIGDLPLPAQAALLRVLQEREVTPVGGHRPVAVDVRVIAASHRDLEQAVAAGQFREDLLARLAGYVVEVPSVRARPEDLGALIAQVLAKLGEPATTVRFAPDAARALLSYAWPRNVRELEQALGSAIALADGERVELEHLPPAVATSQRPETVAEDDLSPSERHRRDELVARLAEHRGNIAAVGRAMGVARMQVHRWLDRYRLDIDAFRDRDPDE